MLPGCLVVRSGAGAVHSHGCDPEVPKDSMCSAYRYSVFFSAFRTLHRLRLRLSSVFGVLNSPPSQSSLDGVDVSTGYIWLG
jgi:hypothetical protein